LNHLPLLAHILDAAIFLAVLTQAVSLADFILLPPQKERLEAWCKDLTRRLDVINTASFLQKWLLASRRVQIGTILFCIFSIVAVLGPAIYLGFVVFSHGFSWPGVGLIVLTWHTGFLGTSSTGHSGSGFCNFSRISMSG
jgi:hypothetical protein